MKSHPHPFIFLLSLALSLPAAAEVPEQVNLQGRLVDGTNLVNGSVMLGIRLFNAEAGAQVYAETQQVTVVDGLYNLHLGASNTVPNSLYAAATNSELWLELEVDGTTLSPREAMAAVPFAFQSHGVIPGGITADMLQPGSVTASALATGAVTYSAIGAGAVMANNIATGAVQAAALADGAVGSATIADGSLTSNDFATVTERVLCAVLEAFTNMPGSQFGTSVAIVNNSRLAVGAPETDHSTFNTDYSEVGAAWLFDEDGAPLALLDNPEKTNSNARFGISLAGNGVDRILVGADQVDEGGFSIAGRTHLYDADGNFLLSITNPLASETFQFGYVIESLDSDHFAVCAPFGRTSVTGAVFVIRASDGALIQTIRDDGMIGFSLNPRSFGLLGTNTLIFGNTDDSSGAPQDGLVHLYAIDSGSRILSITNPVPEGFQFFGASIAVLSTNLFAVGCPFHDQTNSYGAVFLYDAGGNLVNSIIPEIEPGDNFGFAMDAVDGTNLIIGAHGVDPNGRAYVYDSNGTLLETLPPAGSQTPNGDVFGLSVAGSGDQCILIGDPQATSSSGEAHLYKPKTTMPGVTASSVAAGSITPAQFDLPAVDDRYVRRAGDTVEGNLDIEGRLKTEGGTTLEGLMYVRTFNNQNISIGQNVAFGSSQNVLTYIGASSNVYSRSLVVNRNTSSTSMAIDSNGFVGIGTFFPSNTLDVVGEARIHDDLEVDQTVTANRMLTGNGSSGSPSLGFEDDTNTGLYAPSPNANAISFAAGGNEQMRLDGTRLHLGDGLTVTDFLGVGTNNPAQRLHVVHNSTPMIVDRQGSDGNLIRFYRDNVQQGSISVSGATVSYNNFTGSHPGWTEDPIDIGMLVSLTGINQRLNDDPQSEILYGIKLTDTYNDQAVLGIYSGLLEPGDPEGPDNPHMIQAVGNSEVWVIEGGQNVRPGDYLIASSIPGHVMVDDRAHPESHIIGKSASLVNWDEIPHDADGMKRTKISILFGAFTRRN